MINNICPLHIINAQVCNVLMEDSLIFPDYTANLVENKLTTATIITREDMVLCGSQWVNQAFLNCDPNSDISWSYKDGDHVAKNTVLCEVSALSRSLLTAERSALNFLQCLSATATLVSQYTKLLHGHNVKLMDTRKTIPGLRLAQKYAVTVGGGYNQRVGLYDGVLIKENHIISAGGIANVLQKAFSITPKHIPIQIEVETFNELKEAIQNGAKLLLLDNMTPKQISQCVEYTHGVDSTIELEASGNISLNNIIDYAKTGVHRISIGGLTKNITAIDLSMRINL